jgi:enoyl-[acyl-carrier protein] reductase/trans-2-enoyl-CoA reductase (NAD+)
MVIKPKIRGFICTTAHPEGCAESVRRKIEYVKQQTQPAQGPKKVLVLGASQGFGLSTRIVSTFGSNADTLGVFFEKPSMKGRPASGGWYMSAAFEAEAAKAGRYAKSINGDAFSNEIKAKTIQAIKEDLGQVDLVVYSLAAPRRTHPESGETFSSTLKPREEVYSNKTVNSQTGEVSNITLDIASPQEIADTVAVMGGEDWKMWTHALQEAGVLADNCINIAYSYLGPEVTHPIYKGGTIGAAKRDLEATALELDTEMKKSGGRAFVSVNKALVTQASSAIPVIPLYISLLYRTMKEKGVHEGCIEQIQRLFTEHMYVETIPVDESGRIRVDDWELREDVQDGVKAAWVDVKTENFKTLADYDGYQDDFLGLFGFGFDNVNYDAEVDPDVTIKGLID